MTRTRRGVVDQDNTWIIREELEWNPADPVPPGQDYIIVPTFDIHSAGDLVYSQIVIWGVGLISFGPVTFAQTIFFDLPRQQILPRDVHFFFFGVTG